MPSRIQLSSVAESSFKKTGSDVLSEKHSLPTATNTAPIFHTMHSNREVEASLDEIAAIGKSEHWFLDQSGLVILPNIRLGTGGFGEVLEGSFYGATVAVKVPSCRKSRRTSGCTLCAMNGGSCATFGTQIWLPFTERSLMQGKTRSVWCLKWLMVKRLAHS